MADPATEKAPVDRCDYEGLQLDTRARDETEKDLAATHRTHSPQSPEHYHPPDWTDEKAMLAERDARHSREATAAVESSNTSSPSTSTTRAPMISLPPPDVLDGSVVASHSREQRICGLRRRWFWSIFVIILIIIIVTAIVGGVVGGRMSASSTATPTISSNSSSSSSLSGTGPTILPGASNPFLPESDVMVDSPLQVVSFSSDAASNSAGGQSPSDTQAHRLYFQSAHGNIKEAVYNGVLAPWQDAVPIFTDAINNTGLAVVSYMNTTANKRQSTIFYVDSYMLLQEKRNYPGIQTWERGTLEARHQRAVGNLSLPFISSQQDPENHWDSYRMAAVYSTKFHSGPGIRFFYHAQSDSGATWVQEMIWNQQSDSWTEGTQIKDAWPNSHLAATIEPSTLSLRLFYSAGNLTLQESYLSNISQADGQYTNGLSVPNLLAHNSADLAVVSTSHQTLLYYYAATGILSIRELLLPPISSYSSQSTTSNAFAPDPAKVPIVAQPALLTNTSQISLYQPIGATVSGGTVNQSVESVHVFWAEGVVDAGSGYSALRTVGRTVDMPWGTSSYGAAAGQVGIPLGNVNTEPWLAPGRDH